MNQQWNKYDFNTIIEWVEEKIISLNLFNNWTYATIESRVKFIR